MADNFYYLLATKKIDFTPSTGDTFKIILMQSGFVFNRGTHEEYADISSSELPTNYGYTAGGVALSGISVTSNTTLHKTVITWNNPSWAITGTAITASGAIIYDDTVSGDPLVEYIDFGGDLTQDPGGTFIISNVSIDIGKVTGI